MHHEGPGESGDPTNPSPSPFDATARMIRARELLADYRSRRLAGTLDETSYPEPAIRAAGASIGEIWDTVSARTINPSAADASEHENFVMSQIAERLVNDPAVDGVIVDRVCDLIFSGAQIDRLLKN